MSNPQVDHFGRVSMPLPHGGVSLRVSRDRIEILHTHQVRRWIFWKRWRTDVLVSGPCRVRAGNTVRLEQRGPGRFIARIDDETVLTYPKRAS